MLKANKTDLEKFNAAYQACALWSSTDDEGEPLDSGDHHMVEETIIAMERDCLAFWCANSELIAADPGRAGHDFWLTRNGHGAGFWDGDWPEADGEALTAASKAFGEVDLYVGDDGLIYQG